MSERKRDHGTGALDAADTLAIGRRGADEPPPALPRCPGRVLTPARPFGATTAEAPDLEGRAALARLRDALDERDRLLARAERARAESEAARRLKDEFLLSLSHELRTPLTAVLGWAYLLMRTPPDPERLARGLAAIERNALRQAAVTDALLEAATLLTGRAEIRPTPVDPHWLAEAAAAGVRAAAAAKRIAFSVDIEACPGVVVVDPARFRQAIWHLLANAVKFTPSGGRVELRLRSVDGHLEIGVRDSGEGIDASLLPHVFEPFRQGEGGSTRRFGGLGLGLALVRQVIEAHGGTVRAESAGRGHGALFVAHVPLPSPEASGTAR